MLPIREQRILVTGGAGFIGSAVCRHLVRTGRHSVVNVDKLTYAGNLESLRSLAGEPAYSFYRLDITDADALREVLKAHRINRIVHLAAESHVDRSIEAPAVVIETNVVGTFRLLTAALGYWRELPPDEQEEFRLLHVSSDEVFGDLPFDDSRFTEDTAYAPSSPYSASKAAADHLVRAWHRTYGLPVVLANASNNYGPFQFPEKLIPLAILNAVERKPIPVYGRGANVRDWLFVDDHVAALDLVMARGTIGENYLIGARSERANLAVVESICDILDARCGGPSRRDLITYVPDRPGHDRRYAIDPSKIEDSVGWAPTVDFEEGLARTVDWYLDNEWWWRPLRGRSETHRRAGTER